MVSNLEATGMVSSVVGNGVADSSGNVVAALVLAQYNPKLTVLLDKQSPTKILGGAVKGAQAFSTGRSTVTNHVLHHTQVRLIQSAQISVAVSYQKGGMLIEVLGPTPAAVLAFMNAYLGATASV